MSCWRLGLNLAIHSVRPMGLEQSEGKADQRRAASPNQGIVSGEGALESKLKFNEQQLLARSKQSKGVCIRIHIHLAVIEVQVH